MSEQRVVVVSSGGGIPPPTSVTLVSGTAINVSGSPVLVSGAVVNISGSVVTAVISGNAGVQIVSGFNRVNIGGSGIFLISVSGAGMGTANSGGNVLFSCGPIVSVTLRSMSGNQPMMIGGASVSNYPASGIGLEMFAGETVTLRVTNTNQISVFNESGNGSGQYVNILTTCGYS